MFHSIDTFLYEMRFAVLILLLPPMLWAVWVYWAVLTSPASVKPDAKNSSKRHSHRMRAQKAAQQEQSHGAVALADNENQSGNQSNLLDALALDEDQVATEELREDSGFHGADTQKIDANIVDQLVNDVTDKVAAQIEALSGEAVSDEMQDLLETVQEDSGEQRSTDQQDLLETIQEDSGEQAVVQEGEHTAAIRKASKMEELGFHRPSDSDEDADAVDLSNSVLNSADVSNLGAKHLARITELGLNDGQEPDQERLRTAQLDDILTRLDSVLENPKQHAETEAVALENNESAAFSNASTQVQIIQDGLDNEIAEATGAHSAGVINDDIDEDEADSFFNDLVAEDEPGFNEEDVTVREESDHGDQAQADQATINADLEEEAADFFNGNDGVAAEAVEDSAANDESFNIADIASAIAQNLPSDEQDQLDTVKLENSNTSAAIDEQDVLETVAVSNDHAGHSEEEVDPNLETIKEEITDDDLPAWARADSFDEDVDDDDTPKQQNLFDS